MQRLGSFPAMACAAALLAGFVVLVQIGCEDSSQPGRRKSSIGPAGPDESFQRILERLKRRLEQGPRRIVSSGLDPDSSETSSFTLQDTVTGEVFPPDQEGEPYRAEVMIRTHSDYVHTRTVPEPAIEQPKEDSSTDSILSLLEEGGELPEGGDPLLSPEVSLSDPAAGPSGDDTTASHAKPGTHTERAPPLDEVKRYPMIYRNDRWELEEPLPEDKEALARVFEYAFEYEFEED